MDDVKEMNQICTYSKCVTLRDGQKMDKVKGSSLCLNMSQLIEGRPGMNCLIPIEHSRLCTIYAFAFFLSFGVAVQTMKRVNHRGLLVYFCSRFSRKIF